jgi:putative toxin-antitoxin system antitoxin component (TIGR02293 family)
MTEQTARCHRATPDLARAIGRRLGARVADDRALADLVVRGRVTLGAVERLREGGFSAEQVYRIVIPQRTYMLRKKRRQAHLSIEEGDRAVRLARVAALAERAFGEAAAAAAWLRAPKRFLDGRSPVEALATEIGARDIEERLWRLEHGLAA